MDRNTQVDLAGSEPLLAQANLARIRGQWGEAVETCVRVLRVQPGNADAHSLLGDIYRDQGALDDAIQWYRMASDLRPNGPDVEKLRKLEQERDRRAALSGPLTASGALGAYESASGGTTRLMGYSPKRWLNTLTIVSACFLAATILVLATMHSNSGDRGALPRQMQFSSHPMMPTAETGVTLPPVNPNRPSLLPLGEQPRTPVKVHQTGDGLEPDMPTSSRTAPLPAFSAQTAARSAPAGVASRNSELPPAPVQLVKPLNSGLTVAPQDTGSAQERQPAAQSNPRTTGAGGQVDDPGRERDPNPNAGTTKPAPENGAGEHEQSSSGEGIPPP